MNLPEITALIGSTVQAGDTSLSSLIRKPKRQFKENDNPYIVFLVFDLFLNNITFEDLIPYNSEMPVEYNYFGNNPAAALQYYLTREVESLHYLLGSVWNDLHLNLQKLGMGDSQLAVVLRKMAEAGLVTLGAQKGAGSVALDKFVQFANQDIKTIVLDSKKGLKVNGGTIGFEDFIRRTFQSENKSNKFVLVIPAVKLEDGSRIILPQHEDYLALVRKANKLEAEEQDLTKSKHTNNLKNSGICYICHQVKPDVSSEYTVIFSRTGINKIFTTTTINSARNINKNGYNDNYAMCNNCYQKLLAGEKIINEKFIGKIAGESAFILAEGILKPFDYMNLEKFKNSIDFAFQSKDAEEWLKSVELESYFTYFISDQYSLNFLVYRTDGNSVTILQVIEDVPTLYFTKVVRTIGEQHQILKEHLRYMSLGTVYNLIPVKTNKKKEQIDVGRVLSLYKAMLNKQKILANVLFFYATEALEKGLKQLEKTEIDNYLNLRLYNFFPNKQDFFIKNIIMGYLVLMRTCQKLNLLDKKVFIISKGGDEVLRAEKTAGSPILESINDMEKFLTQQGFQKEARALFYLGCLLHRVAVAQYQKEHKTKPILKKINFQGMNINEILRLYEDIIEKLRQYNKFTLFSENLMQKFHCNFGNLEQAWPYNDHANVFYLMSGYAYMVGNRAPDLTDEEKEVLEQELNADDNVENTK
ncbi:TM1802 family CRISPR-associated protein [Zhaonella formicivorans]|uniref:TM1802 family CRISPR-associated protein n=1 Tax=Zhaonella formicivorans TaxID=2528593 RepID=UPI0010CF7392|nr:TM1802 family CRISPR-associated protein [Zhaonella formicivorans]